MVQPVLSAFLRSLILFAALLVHDGFCPAAKAQTGGSNRLASLSLTQAQVNEDGSYWGLLEFTLANKVKTYWRTPGEAGLPPRFDWTASGNLADLTLSWPAPMRFEDGGGQGIGYEKSLSLPIHIKPHDPSKPVVIDLTLYYAVCETLCLPLHERIRAVFDKSKGVTGVQQTALQKALQRVPKKQNLGSPDAPSLMQVSGEDDMLRIALKRDPAMPVEDIFVEGPDGWVFGAPKPLAGHEQIFRVPILERPQRDASLAQLTLAVTLVTASLSSETVLTLDKQGRAP